MQGKKNIFVTNYFKKIYIDKFNIKEWNYFKIYGHRTNNECESDNHILNSKFNKKATIWKHFAELINVEHFLYIKIDTTPHYTKYDEEIKRISDSNDLDKREKTIDIWNQASLEFPLYDIDL